MDTILSTIKSPDDIKKLDEVELSILCEEIRQAMIQSVSVNGGHLSSNLGAVELTVAIHKVFNSPKDRIVFDVGHQCYTHKMLTGRYDRFNTLRKKGGISGFCRPNESEHDTFFSGHSGTAVSAGLGLACANKIRNNEDYVITVIGDGSFTNGMVYEALNNGGRSKTKHIIILNDNNMSISENVGSVAKYLAVIRSKPEYYTFKASAEKTLSKIPSIGKKVVEKLYDFKTDVKKRLYSQSTFFEDLGYRYMGPIDGHNIPLLIDALESAKSVNGTVLLHVNTIKGNGYKYAERFPSRFHGVGPFDIESGKVAESGDSFSRQFGQYLCKFGADNDNICAITAAMGLGTGLETFRRRYRDRFFDVGIAEEHAVTFASGLSKNGMIPIFAVYSTFLQRCYDQIVHDVSLQGLKVIFAIDRAGFVGDDGETHNGLMDVAFLRTIPNIKIYSPCCYNLLQDDLEYAINTEKCAVAIRYPRGEQGKFTDLLRYDCFAYSSFGNKESETCIVTYSRTASFAIEGAMKLSESGVDVFVIALNQIKPIEDKIIELLISKKHIFFFEEGFKSGSVGEEIAMRLLEKGYNGQYKLTCINDEFVSQASIPQLLEAYSLDTKGIIKTVSEELQ